MCACLWTIPHASRAISTGAPNIRTLCLFEKMSVCDIHTVMTCIHKRTSQLATSFVTVGEERGGHVIARIRTDSHISANIRPVKIHLTIANAYSERRSFVVGV